MDSATYPPMTYMGDIHAMTGIGVRLALRFVLTTIPPS